MNESTMKLCDYLHNDYVAEHAIVAVTIDSYEWTIKSFGKLCKVLREIVAEAGVRKGTFKWFRRSSITARERIEPGLGTLAAGHATGDMARKHYIDRSQLDPVPLPPALNVTPRPAAALPEEPAPPIDGVVFTTTLLGGDQW
jgi:hypothetical protein